MKSLKHFLSITDLSAKEIWQVLTMAKKIKGGHFNPNFQSRIGGSNYFTGKSMVMLFEKPSLRTKLSFDIGFTQLGGHVIYFGSQEVGLGTREPAADIAKVVSTMADLIVARVFSHQSLVELAQHSKIPIINALSDLEHPCQTLADLLTIWEVKGRLTGLTLAYIGDGENNVTHSLVLGCALLGVNFKCASPKGYWMKPELVKEAEDLAIINGSDIFQTEDPKEAVKGADVVYTDTWISMGDEVEKKRRLKVFMPYQINQKLMDLASSDAVFMHDMPAYRNNEVTTEVIDGNQSVIIQQAENRLHAQKALMLYVLGLAKS